LAWTVGELSLFWPANITNFGVITGNVDGVNVNGGGTLVNEAGASVTAIMESAIAETSGGTETIVNSGTISSALPAISVQNKAEVFITNNVGGVITGTNGDSIDTRLSSGQATILNAGLINGSVNLGDGANTVTLVSGGIINGSLDLGSNSKSKLILDGSGDQSFNQAVTGSIRDLGSLIKQGSGMWTVDENLSAPVSTDVIAGILNVAGNKTLTTPLMMIENGGALIGSGMINGVVVNSGLVSPGESPGTLAISGNYTQNPNGTLRIEIGGLGVNRHDMLAVGGHASLAGTLQLIPLNGFQLHVGDKVTFLTAKAGVSGNFSAIQNEFATVVKTQIIILPIAVQFVGTQGSFVDAACNSNTAAVARALDSAAGDSRAAALISFLDSEPFSKLCSDFALIAPEQLASVFNIGVSLANVQSANLDRRMDDIHTGSTGFSSAGFTMNGSTPSFSAGLSSPTRAEGKAGPSVLAPIPENRWGVFVTGLGEFTHVDSTDIARGFDLQTGGFTLGVDYRIGSNFAIGLIAGYAHTNADLANGGDLDVNSGKFGIYATAFSRGLYVDTAVTGGISEYDSHRAALGGTASGNTDGGDLNVLVNGGYDWTKGDLSIGPTASFQYTYVNFNGFTESGSVAMLCFKRDSWRRLSRSSGRSYD
jgi:uncharacterized protein with beta-barrel porin domain